MLAEYDLSSGDASSEEVDSSTRKRTVKQSAATSKMQEIRRKKIQEAKIRELAESRQILNREMREQYDVMLDAKLTKQREDILAELKQPLVSYIEFLIDESTVPDENSGLLIDKDIPAETNIEDIEPIPKQILKVSNVTSRPEITEPSWKQFISSKTR